MVEAFVPTSIRICYKVLLQDQPQEGKHWKTQENVKVIQAMIWTVITNEWYISLVIIQKYEN